MFGFLHLLGGIILALYVDIKLKKCPSNHSLKNSQMDPYEKSFQIFSEISGEYCLMRLRRGQTILKRLYYFCTDNAYPILTSTSRLTFPLHHLSPLTTYQYKSSRWHHFSLLIMKSQKGIFSIFF